LLRETSSEVPLVALKGADQVIRERFFKKSCPNAPRRCCGRTCSCSARCGAGGLAEVSQQQPGAGQQTPQQERSAGGDARGAAGLGLDTPIIGERVRVLGRRPGGRLRLTAGAVNRA